MMIYDDLKNALEEQGHRQQTEIIQRTAERNTEFFDNEMEKLNKWSDDVKNSLEIELKNLDKEIKYRKTESKKILNLDEKVKTQRQIKDMEKKRNAMRYELYQRQDEIEERKENLIDEIEKRMKQQIKLIELFSVKWHLS